MSQEKQSSERSLSEVREAAKSTPSQASAHESDDFEQSPGHLEGWRYWFTMIAIFSGLFLVQMEFTIISTALVAITNDLKDFQHATWVANAYFLVWSGFLVLWSQFSYTVGRKPSLLLSFGTFVIFSAACAAAQTALQLYIFRGLQGLAGAGVFSLPMIILSEAVPPSQMPKYTGFYAVVSLAAITAGPLIGGAIVNAASWRWIFIINIPPGVLVFLIILLAIPNGFPHQHKSKAERPQFRFRSLRQLDLVGALLFLCLSILGVTALQEADTSLAWSSSAIICLLVLSGVSAIAFVIWERYITKCKESITPVMSYHLVQRRTLAMFASSFLIGAPFIFTIVQIQQRLQIIDGYSPLKAAVHVLPYTIVINFGGVLASIFGRKFQSRPVYGLLIGGFLQLAAVIGFAADSLPASPQKHLPASHYVFQCLMGLGVGFSYGTNFMGIYYAIGNRKDLIAPSVGANLQFRYLGCAVGLAATTAAFNTSIQDHLSGFLNRSDIVSLLESSRLLATLSQQIQTKVLDSFSTAFALEWKVMCGFIGLQVIVSILTY